MSQSEIVSVISPRNSFAEINTVAAAFRIVKQKRRRALIGSLIT
ncbi:MULTISPECIES: hypothetical protein [Pelosinus]|nr:MULTISPECIES: hypothetical protein [Pelosinus]